MKNSPFISIFARSLDEYVQFQRSSGYVYEKGVEALRPFDRFLQHCACIELQLTNEILLNYVASVRHFAGNTQNVRISAVRGYASWLHRLKPESSLMPEVHIIRPTIPRYYLYPPSEIAILMHAAHRLDGVPDATLRALGTATLIGLLYATGLRIGEALGLNIIDMELKDRRLCVRKGKQNKDRYVALQESSVIALQQYLAVRLKQPPGGLDSPVFTGANSERLKYSSFSRVYRKLLRQENIGKDAATFPCIHDLRHTFACACLLQWYEQGDDVNTKLPFLSTALGHVGIESTQIYLHHTTQLFQNAARRFHNTFTKNCKGVSL